MERCKKMAAEQQNRHGHRRSQEHKNDPLPVGIQAHVG